MKTTQTMFFSKIVGPLWNWSSKFYWLIQVGNSRRSFARQEDSNSWSKNLWVWREGGRKALKFFIFIFNFSWFDFIIVRCPCCSRNMVIALRLFAFYNFYCLTSCCACIFSSCLQKQLAFHCPIINLLWEFFHNLILLGIGKLYK